MDSRSALAAACRRERITLEFLPFTPEIEAALCAALPPERNSLRRPETRAAGQPRRLSRRSIDRPLRGRYCLTITSLQTGPASVTVAPPTVNEMFV
jgi:hypothetical protein